MASKPVFCTDELGQRWVVYDADPAWPSVRALWNRGVREVVLPRQTLITGEVVAVATPQDLSKYPVDNPAVATLLRRQVRLRDCTWYLNQGN